MKLNLQFIRHIKHSTPLGSYNIQRDMIIRFDSLITGYYADKEKRSTISISDNPSMDYFDSNLYPTLIR